MKAKIKAAYIAALKKTYPGIYTPGSRSLELAGEAVDNALAGRLKLRGECWSAALEEVTGTHRHTMAALAALPDVPKGCASCHREDCGGECLG